MLSVKDLFESLNRTINYVAYNIISTLLKSLEHLLLALLQLVLFLAIWSISSSVVHVMSLAVDAP